MNLPTRDEICVFVETSISNKQYNEQIIFQLGYSKGINLIKPKGKPPRWQSSQNIILELAKASPTNYILQILPSW